MSLRQTVLLVAILNLAYFGVEFAVALAIGSVSLFADSVDFLEDASINLLIAVGLGWSAQNRARLGMVLAGVILVPVAASMGEEVARAVAAAVVAALRGDSPDADSARVDLCGDGPDGSDPLYGGAIAGGGALASTSSAKAPGAGGHARCSARVAKAHAMQLFLLSCRRRHHYRRHLLEGQATWR